MICSSQCSSSEKTNTTTTVPVVYSSTTPGKVHRLAILSTVPPKAGSAHQRYTDARQSTPAKTKARQAKEPAQTDRDPANPRSRRQRETRLCRGRDCETCRKGARRSEIQWNPIPAFAITAPLFSFWARAGALFVFGRLYDIGTSSRGDLL